MHDLIVIGGGLAGLSATLYAMRRHLDVLLVSNSLGGKTNYHLGLPRARRQPVLQGADIVRQFMDELQRIGFNHKAEHVDRITKYQGGFAVHTQQGSKYLASSVIVATGVRHQRLQIPGEDKFFMRSLSYSALSYAPCLADETVVIIGDGKLAIRAAAELLLSVKQVYVVGPSGDVLSTPLGKKLMAASNATVLEHYQVREFQGDDYARKVIVESPNGVRQELDGDVFFVEQSIIPNSQIVKDLVDLEPEGHIKVDERSRTNVPGIFAAGDVTNSYIEQVWVAVGGGAKAALSAYEYVLPTL